MVLFEQLGETYPSEVVEPYGEVLVVPAKAFKEEWRKQLENEGIQIYSNAFKGQACFFLRKKAQTQSNSQIEPKTKNAKFKPWSAEQEEMLLKMQSEGLSFEAIAERLNKSAEACYIKWKRLMAKTSNEKKLQLNEMPKPNDDVLEEFVSALNTLCPKHRRICVTMLKNANLFLEGENP